MTKQIAIAEARANLPALLREVECGAAVELTRRGKPVAVLLSVHEYQRLTEPKGGFGKALREFREKYDLEEMWKDGDPFEGVRDRSPGRDVVL